LAMRLDARAGSRSRYGGMPVTSSITVTPSAQMSAWRRTRTAHSDHRPQGASGNEPATRSGVCGPAAYLGPVRLPLDDFGRHKVRRAGERRDLLLAGHQRRAHAKVGQLGRAVLAHEHVARYGRRPCPGGGGRAATVGELSSRPPAGTTATHT